MPRITDLPQANTPLDDGDITIIVQDGIVKQVAREQFVINPEIDATVAAVLVISADITAVAAIDTDVSAVAAIDTDVTTVVSNAANITTVAGISANVTTVAGISANVTTVAGNSTNVTTVAGISADVASVAAIDTDVSAVAAIDADVTTCAGISADITTVAAGGGAAPKNLTVNSQTDNYTLVLGDSSNYVRMNKASAVNLTVPANATAAFPIGTQIVIRQVGAGQVTVVAAGGVTINTPDTLKLRIQGSSATLIKVGTNEWDLAGDLEV